MDLSAFMKRYADEIGGQYTAYDSSHSIIIVPVHGARFQTVIGTIKTSELYNRKIIGLSSKVCRYEPGLDLKSLLEQVSYFSYCRFMISEEHVQVEAVTALEGTDEDALKEMIQEVANIADQFEMRLTGADVH
jgi:hypothetical protein